MIEIDSHESAENGDYMVTTRVSMNSFLDNNKGEVIRGVMDKISDYIAQEFIEKHGVEIMAKLSPDAIANLTIAAAGAKVNETLNKKMPDKIMEIETIKTRTVERGFWGGIKRIY